MPPGRSQDRRGQTRTQVCSPSPAGRVALPCALGTLAGPGARALGSDPHRWHCMYREPGLGRGTRQPPASASGCWDGGLQPPPRAAPVASAAEPRLTQRKPQLTCITSFKLHRQLGSAPDCRKKTHFLYSTQITRTLY